MHARAAHLEAGRQRRFGDAAARSNLLHNDRAGQEFVYLVLDGRRSAPRAVARAALRRFPVHRKWRAIDWLDAGLGQGSTLHILWRAAASQTCALAVRSSIESRPNRGPGRRGKQYTGYDTGCATASLARGEGLSSRYTTSNTVDNSRSNRAMRPARLGTPQAGERTAPAPATSGQTDLI